MVYEIPKRLKYDNTINLLDTNNDIWNVLVS